MTTRYEGMSPGERAAIDAGQDFVTGDYPWPSTWVDRFEYKGFAYTLHRNSQGHSVYWDQWHIGQIARYGKPND